MVFIGAGNDSAFKKLCSELECPELVDDERFLKNIDRVNNRDALKTELEVLLMRIDGATLCDRLLADGLPAGPIYNTQEVVEHPHTKFREMLIEKDWYRMTGTPIKFSRTPGSLRYLPPKFGEHSREILLEAGISEASISQLLEQGIVLEKRR